MKLIISEKKYKKLLSQKRRKKHTTLKDKKLLDYALYNKYCRCLAKFEYNKDTRGYPFCMNSVYKNRGIKPPKNASRKCNKAFKKNIGK